MSWQERRCNAEGFGRPEPFFFPCEGRTFSPLPRRGSGGMPMATCALRGRFRFLRKATDNSASSADAASSSAQTPIILGVCLRKTATGSFTAVMDGAYCPSIFFFGKETKTRVRRFSVPRKGCDLLWQFIIWKQRS